MEILNTTISRYKDRFGEDACKIKSKIRFKKLSYITTAITTSYGKHPSGYSIDLLVGTHHVMACVHMDLKPKQAHARLLNCVVMWHHEGTSVNADRITHDLSCYSPEIEDMSQRWSF